MKIIENVNGKTRTYRIQLLKPITWKWNHATLGLLNSSVLRDTFLPLGYPHSVHAIYTPVHIRQFAETFIWSCVSVLCSQAMLLSVGLPNDAATSAGSAVGIQWVLKDSIGEIMKLTFIRKFAGSFDSHPKTWKWIGEIFSLSGAALQLSTCLFPSSYFLPLAGIGFGFRGIHFAIYNATHMTFTRNFALHGNVGDLVAKDDSQMSAAHFLGTALGAGILSMSHSPITLFGLFGILGPIHLYTTLSLLRATRFPVLNQATLILLSKHFVESGECLIFAEVEKKCSWFTEKLKSKKHEIVWGASLDQAFQNANELQSSFEIFQKEKFVIGTSRSSICFATDCSTDDIIVALLCIVHFQHFKDTASTIKDSLDWAKTQAPIFKKQLMNQGWNCDHIFWNDRGIRFEKAN